MRTFDLVRYLASTTLKAEHAGTAFGILWWLLDPLLLMGVYTFMVRVVFQRGGPDYPLFVLTALITWKWFTGAVNAAMTRTIAGGVLMKQVPFPRVALPLSAVAAETVQFAAGMTMLVALAAVLGSPPRPALALLPVIAAIQLTLILGTGLLLAALNVFFRDTQSLAGYALRLLWYLSPGIYAASVIPPSLRDLYELNPFAALFVAYRWMVLGDVPPDPVGLARALVVGVALLALGYAYFRRRAPAFVKAL